MQVKHATDGIKPATLCHDIATLFEKHGAFDVLMSLHSFADDQAHFALPDAKAIKVWRAMSNQFLAMAEKVQS